MQRTQLQKISLLHRLARPALVASIWILASPVLAHAHGGLAGPGEVGPPIATSIALAFVCYWVVILWPASKRNDDMADGVTGTQNKNGDRDRNRARTVAKSGVAKNRAHLKNAGVNGR